MSFTNLHLHTKYSLLDGLIKPNELVEKCKSLGQTAVACTDHGTVAGLVEFHKECTKGGVKPLLGAEFYHERGTNENYHLVVLARNLQGYRNLIKINNLAQENIYKKPRINDDMLRLHGQGLIVLTACIQGYLPQSFLAGKTDWQWYNAVKGWVDSVYLEVQNHGIAGEDRILNEFVESGLPCVATTDAHFLNKEHAYAHEVALAVSMNKKAGEFKFDGSGYYVMEEDEISLPQQCKDLTDIVAHDVEVYDFGYSSWQLPEIDADPVHELQKLEFKLHDYLIDVYGFEEVENDSTGECGEYLNRLAFEFDVISKNGFLSYFLIVADICRFVDEDLKSIRGWGRGSAAGSLVAMLYGITKIDPIRWKLYFERFLNPDRISPPDIDLDFRPDDRPLVLDYMRKKYGRVYQIGTYSTLGSKEVVLSCAKATNHYTDLTEYIPVEAPVPTIAELMKREAFSKHVIETGEEDFVEMCITLEGLPKNSSAHASGVIIDVADEVPVKISKSGVNAGIPVTAYDMYSLEDLKLTKIDVLGVNVLATVDRTCKALGIDIKDFPLDDQKTFDLFNSGFTLGVFQFETHSFAHLIKDLHPDNFDELVDLNTLGRPGCLESGMSEEYISRKFGRTERKPIHPTIRDTGHQGLPLFQEQMMEIAREFSGFTMSEADTLRKAIGKKKKDVMESIHSKFVDGAVTLQRIPAEEAEEVWATLEKSARYTWNLSHAVCYTYISYWTMYLAANYPVQFFCELLNSADGSGDTSTRRRILLSECRRRGIKVSYPDVNKSALNYTVVDDMILLGLSGIKFVGEKSVNAILEARNSDFLDSADLKARSKVTSRIVEYLKKAGCFLNEYIPSREDEVEALGYSISGRAIDQGWLKYIDGAGEILEIRNITTKKGDPMCFLSVDFHEETRSLVVFPKMYEQYKEILVKGAVFGFITNEDILEKIFDLNSFDNLVIEIPDNQADQFLTFYPSCTGRPNISAAGYELASVNLTQQMFEFIETEFGVVRIYNRYEK